jgi:hypothetical protein
VPVPDRVLGVLGRAGVRAGLGPARGPHGGLAASLLVIYPVSDAVATVFDARSSRVSAGRAQRLNLTVDVAAAICVLAGIQSILTARSPYSAGGPSSAAPS